METVPLLRQLSLRFRSQALARRVWDWAGFSSEWCPAPQHRPNGHRAALRSLGDVQSFLILKVCFYGLLGELGPPNDHPLHSKGTR